MTKKIMLSPNSILVLIILAMVLIINIISLLTDLSNSSTAAMQAYRDNMMLANIAVAVKFILIVFMAWLAFRLIKSAGNKWNERMYRGIKQIGWLSVVVVLLDSVSAVLKEQYSRQNQGHAGISSDPGVYTDIISQALFSAPVVWLLIACIFLIADILNTVAERG